MRYLDRWGDRGLPPLTPDPLFLEPFEPNEPCAETTFDVITVSRMYGSRGSVVARMAAEKLGFEFYDKELLDHIVDTTRAEQHHVDRYDEKAGAFRYMVLEMLDTSFTHGQYVRSLIRAVREIASGGRCVIVGRGAQFIVPSSFRVRMVAPFDLRVKRMAEEDNMTLRESARVVRAADADRERFLRAVFRKDGRDPENYHIVINTGAMSFEEAADLIVAGVRTTRCRLRLQERRPASGRE